MISKTPSATNHGNVVVMFMPFSCSENTSEVQSLIIKSDFTMVEDHGGYLYPYVHQSSKHESHIAKCSHFIMSLPHDELWEVAPDGNLSTTEKARIRYQNRSGIAILNPSIIHVYLFRTGLHLLAYELSVHEWQLATNAASIPPLRDPFRVAAALQGLSRLNPSATKNGQLSQANRIRAYGNMGAVGQTLLQKAEGFLTHIGLTNARFFEHSAESHRKAGIFVHVQADNPATEHRTDYSEGLATSATVKQRRQASLYYLANVWDAATFPYEGSTDVTPLQFSPAPDIEWAASYEALACITYLHANASGSKSLESRNKFLMGTFEKNVRTTYLFMYALLLHQKYTYLAQLSTLNANTVRDDIDLRTSLRDSQRRLEEFRLNYVYARVSDTPQYQMLYDKVRKAFEIEAMEADIREPINELARLERVEEKREAEREKRKDDARESKLNRAMYIVAALSIVSTFVDGEATIKTVVQFVKLFCGDQRWIEKASNILIFILFFFLLGVFIAVIKELQKKKEKNNA